MKEKILAHSQMVREKARASTRKFKKELNKQVNTAIVAAFSLIIALAWKDVITEYVNKISSISPIQGKVIGALLVTLISVIGILIITKLLSEEQ